MFEVIWHGRGGQGAFTAARLLGAAVAMEEGAYGLAFPSFGPERRGAPMRAFTKLSTKPIGDRSAISFADYAVYLDDTLLGEGWENELKPGGIVLVNSTRVYESPRVIALDANGISQEVLGRPIPNTVFLGAIGALMGGKALSEENLREAIRLYMPAKLHESNFAIVDEAWRVTEELLEEKRARGKKEESPGANIFADGCIGASVNDVGMSSEDGETERAVDALGETGVPGMESRKQNALDPQSYAHTTCFEAGYLVAKNAGWRNVRPVIDPKACTGCLQCYLFCPDGTIYKTEHDPQRHIPRLAGQPAFSETRKSPAAPVAVDYDFCKGCGICAKACRFNAIAMESESNFGAGHEVS